MPRRNLTVAVLGVQDETRFWAKVDKRDPADCWPWIGAKNKLGYGRYKLKGRVYYAHRIAYATRWGDSPKRVIAHRCGNPACVNPDHLIKQTREASIVERVKKPSKDFPLFPHQTGRWAKKVRGKLVYFGTIADDPTGTKARDLWLEQRDDLLAGRKPRPKGDGLTVADLCNRFLTTKKSLLVAGELSPRTFDDAYRTCESVIEAFGKTQAVEHLTPSDFERLRARIAKRCGAVRLGNEVKRVRGIFKYAFEMDLLQVPVKFGPVFKVPKQRIVRLEKDAKGKKLLAAKQIQTLIESATPAMAAMIYLGANAALGNADVGRLEYRHLDFKTGWLNFPRPKTGVDRRCWLWPETIAAIKAAIEHRPAHKDDANAVRVFITAQGHSWHKDTPDSPVSKEFTKLLKAHGFHRPGIGFYTLRHVFATVAGDTLDQAAIDCVMGHAPPKDDMRARYRQEVSDDRIKRACEHVRGWLLKGGAK